MVVNFVGTKISRVSLSVLSMIINEVSGVILNIKVKYLQRLVFRYKNINLLELVKYPVELVKYLVSE